MTDKKITDLELATDLTGATFLIAKPGAVNEQVDVAGMKNYLGIDAKSPIADPEFTGDPKAPTPAVGDNDTSIATTAFIENLLASRPGVLGFLNVGLSVAPNANALQIDLKQADGVTDATAAQPIVLPFRDLTQTKGAYAAYKWETSLSSTIPNTATLGQSNGVAATIHVYVIRLADGNWEIAVSGTDYGTIGWFATTNVLDTAADSASVVYSPSGEDNVPFVKVAELTNTQATAGVWLTAPTVIKMAPFGVTSSDLTTALAGKVAKAGDTMTGNLTIAKTTPIITLNKAASGQNAIIIGQTNGATRWAMYLGTTAAESGSDAGSDFVINRYDDAGNYVASPLSITRSNGRITLGEGQLRFPAAQNASSDANTFDDYEEGTWTPTIRFGGNTTGIAYTTQLGRYTKIGDAVTLSCRTTLSSKGSATGAATMTGIPFTISDWMTAIPELGVAVYTGLNAGFVLYGNGTSLFFRGQISTGQTGSSSISDVVFTATSVLNFSGSHFV